MLHQLSKCSTKKIAIPQGISFFVYRVKGALSSIIQAIFFTWVPGVPKLICKCMQQSQQQRVLMSTADKPGSGGKKYFETESLNTMAAAASGGALRVPSIRAQSMANSGL